MTKFSPFVALTIHLITTTGGECMTLLCYCLLAKGLQKSVI